VREGCFPILRKGAMMKRILLTGIVLVAGIGLVIALSDSSDRVSGPEVVAVPISRTPPAGAPIFELDPSWPKVPEQWVLGEVSSIGVDSQDRILVLHRPRSLLIHAPDQIHMAAPPILEFDVAGNFLRAWGGAGEGFEWPQREHGIHVDHQQNVWIGGNNCPANQAPGLDPVSDDQILKFTRDGQFLMQIGRSNQGRGNRDTRNLREPADVAVYPPTNEVFVADGYGNRRVVVFDADTGEFQRMWGAFGNVPVDEGGCPWPDPATTEIEGDGPPDFLLVHGIKVSNDGLVYAADRPNGRFQVFTIDGEFISQVFMPGGSAGHIAFSPDPEQEFLYVASGGQIVVLNRRSLETLYSFPGSGHHIATDSRGNLYAGRVGAARQAQKYVFKGLASE
jgi:DNA-binding beta-propeller fold protein YncE